MIYEFRLENSKIPLIFMLSTIFDLSPQKLVERPSGNEILPIFAYTQRLGIGSLLLYTPSTGEKCASNRLVRCKSIRIQCHDWSDSPCACE